MESQKINFIFTPGKNHQKYLEQLLDDIIKFASKSVNFCIFADEIDKNFKSKYPINIKLISKNDKEELKSLYFKEGRSDINPFSAYAQFLLPKYFSEYESFIFMEVDQKVKGDTASLWKICKEKSVDLAASSYYNKIFEKWTLPSFNRLYPGKTMFNTGVMYVDTKKWISENFEKKLYDELYLQKKTNGKRFQFYAQGAINNALHQYIYELPIIYNTTGLGYVKAIKKQIIDDAIILHWNGPKKPWLHNGMYKDLYYEDKNLYNKDDYEIKMITLIKIVIIFKLSYLKRILFNFLKTLQILK